MKIKTLIHDSFNQTFINYLGLSLTLLVPILYSRWTQNPTIIKDLSVGLIGIIIIIYVILKNQADALFKLRDIKIEIALLVFYFINILGLVFNPTEYKSVEILISLLFLICFFYIYAFIGSSLEINILYRVIAVASFLVMAMGVVQAMANGSKPISTFGNPNYFGGYLVAQWPLLINNCSEKNRFFKGLAWVNIILFLLNTAFIHSWAMVLSLILSIYMLIFIYVKKQKIRLASLTIYTILICVTFQTGWVKESLVRQVSTDVRPYIWEGTKNLIKEYPLLGCGLGQFIVHYPIYRNPEYFKLPLSVDNTDHAHCEFLELCAETGIMGAISFLIFIIYLLRFMIKKFSKLEYKLQISAYSVLIGVVLLYFENMFDVNLRFMSSKFAFWSYLGWLYGFANKKDESKTLKNTNICKHSLFKIMILIIFIYTFISAFLKPYIADFFYREGVKSRNNEEFEKAIYYYEKALNLEPAKLETLYRLAFLFASIDENEKSIKAYQEVIQIAPYYASVHGNLGTVYLRIKEFKKAQQHLEIHLKLNPYDPDRWCSLASVLLQTNRIEEAKTYLRRVLQLDPKSEFAIKILFPKKVENIETA